VGADCCGKIYTAVSHPLVRVASPRITVTSCLSASREDKVANPSSNMPDLPGCRRILVVEDERVIRDLIALQLSLSGYAVTTAENGREGLRFAQREVFDLVITDGSMPHLTGEMLASVLSKIRPRLPVILLTGSSHFDGTLPYGVRLVLEKPFTLTKLKEVVVQVIGEARDLGDFDAKAC
jgi:CheY-like chemotaxis protein